MRVELESAVKFIISMMRVGHRAQSARRPNDEFFQEPELEVLQMSLMAVMSHQYQNYWFPHSPTRGSAYRCIRINKDKMDPLIIRAADCSGLSCELIRAYLPDELTMWVDPFEVSYRIGEEDGSICVLYEAPVSAAPSPPSSVHSSSSSSSSASSSPGSSFNGRQQLQDMQRQRELQQQQQQQQQQQAKQQLQIQQQRQQQQQQQQQQQYQQQQQHIQQQATQDAVGGNSFPNSNYSSPVKPSQAANVIAFVPPPTYGSPVQFVHPYQSYSAYISS